MPGFSWEVFGAESAAHLIAGWYDPLRANIIKPIMITTTTIKIINFFFDSIGIPPLFNSLFQNLPNPR
jgi:hypothetical protein